MVELAVSLISVAASITNRTCSCTFKTDSETESEVIIIAYKLLGYGTFHVDGYFIWAEDRDRQELINKYIISNFFSSLRVFITIVYLIEIFVQIQKFKNQ